MSSESRRRRVEDERDKTAEQERTKFKQQMESLAHERQYLRALCAQNALVEKARDEVQPLASQTLSQGQGSRSLGSERSENSLRARAVPRLMCGPAQHWSCEKKTGSSSPAMLSRREVAQLPRSEARCREVAVSSAHELRSPRRDGASDGWMVSVGSASGVSRAVPVLGGHNSSQTSRYGAEDRLLRTASSLSENTSISARSAQSTRSMSSDKTSPSHTTQMTCVPHAEPAEHRDAAATRSKDIESVQDGLRLPSEPGRVVVGTTIPSEPRETLRLSIRCLRQPSPRKSLSKSKQQRRLSPSPPPEEMGQVSIDLKAPLHCCLHAIMLFCSIIMTRSRTVLHAPLAHTMSGLG